MSAADLLVCCRCGLIASSVYRAWDKRPAHARPLVWETHNGPSRCVCGFCISRLLDDAMAVMRAYAQTVETCPECRGEGASVSVRWCISCDHKAAECCCDSPDWGWDDTCECCGGDGVIPLRKPGTAYLKKYLDKHA